MRPAAALFLITVCLRGAPWTAALEQANHLRDSGHTADAEKAYQQILGGFDQLSPLDLNALATEFYNQARYRDAELLCRKALAAFDRPGNGLTLDRALIEGNLGVILRTEDRYAEAETLLLDALRQVESQTGPDSLETAHASSGLAALYLVWGSLPK